jgi:hypothetical protein
VGGGDLTAARAGANVKQGKTEVRGEVHLLLYINDLQKSVTLKSPVLSHSFMKKVTDLFSVKNQPDCYFSTA